MPGAGLRPARTGDNNNRIFSNGRRLHKDKRMAYALELALRSRGQTA